MVRLITIQQFQMQIAPRLIGKSLEKLACQPEPECAGTILGFLRFTEVFISQIAQSAPNQIWPAAEINHTAGEAFVHRNVRFTRERIPRVKSGPVTPYPL